MVTRFIFWSWKPGIFFYDTNPGETAGGHLKPGILSITLSLCWVTTDLTGILWVTGRVLLDWGIRSDIWLVSVLQFRSSSSNGFTTFYNCNPQEREYIPPYWGLVMICNIWVIVVSGSCTVLFLCTGTYEDTGSAPSAFLDTHLLSLPTYSWGLLADAFFWFCQCSMLPVVILGTMNDIISYIATYIYIYIYIYISDEFVKVQLYFYNLRFHNELFPSEITFRWIMPSFSPRFFFCPSRFWPRKGNSKGPSKVRVSILMD